MPSTSTWATIRRKTSADAKVRNNFDAGNKLVCFNNHFLVIVMINL